MRGLIFTLPLLLAIGCDDKDPLDTSILIDDTDTLPGDTCPNDLDCDGYTDDVDCDPEDPYVNPGMQEIPYDGRDNDCGGDGDLNDVDGDGYIGSGAGGDDCNDGNPDAHPGAEEQCYNPTDEDCDGTAQGYKDNDCDEDGYVDRGDDATDCDPFDATINPGAAEIWYDGIDQNCDEESDYDADQDGENAREWGGTDCDDADATTNSDTNELWDGVDNNCNTYIDDVDTYDAIQSLEPTSSSGEGAYGSVVDIIGDVTADGNPDVVAGAYETDPTRTGAVYITSLSSGDGVPSSIAATTLSGSTTNSEFGRDLAVLGDIDGDTVDDLLVGAPGDGVAYLFLGSDLDDGGALGTADAAHTVAVSEDGFGIDVVAVGDIDSDGAAEFAVGSGSFDEGSDLWVGVWSGAELADGDLDSGDALVSISTGDVGGETVGGGDFDGDGLPDLVVAYSVDQTGEVVILTGNDISIGGDFDASDLPSLTGPSSVRGGVHNGWLEDADGDGYSELVFSAPDALADTKKGGGIVYIVDGDVATSSDGAIDAVASTTILGNVAGAALTSLDQGGDYDGDGLTDLVVSSVADSTAVLVSTGYVFYGADLAAGTYSTDDYSASFTSDDSQDHTGYAGASGDLDLDGDDELAIGAPRADVSAGAVYVYESLLVK